MEDVCDYIYRVWYICLIQWNTLLTLASQALSIRMIAPAPMNYMGDLGKNEQNPNTTMR